MARKMTEQERQEFLATPRFGVLSVASEADRDVQSIKAPTLVMLGDADLADRC
ncbi:MAG TPA: hypothetical protein VNL16_14650 [Chloroflexota bacterium]|nr:hypothetical protein [Chloroflexota bacterium]